MLAAPRLAVGAAASRRGHRQPRRRHPRRTGAPAPRSRWCWPAAATPSRPRRATSSPVSTRPSARRRTSSTPAPPPRTATWSPPVAASSPSSAPVPPSTAAREAAYGGVGASTSTAPSTAPTSRPAAECRWPPWASSASGRTRHVRVPNVLAARYASAQTARRSGRPEHKIVARAAAVDRGAPGAARAGCRVPDGVDRAYEAVVEQVDLDSIAARERRHPARREGSDRGVQRARRP